MPRRTVLLLTVAAVLACAGCGTDDGASMRSIGTEAGSDSASVPGGASGSASGISGEDLAGGAVAEADVAAQVEDYRGYVTEQVDLTRTETKRLTDAIRAGDLATAKSGFAPSRQGWERIEPIAGLVDELDGRLDARVDDFAGVTDPGFTGWHRIEYLLWEEGDVRAARPFADQLDTDLVTLSRELGSIEVPPLAVALGAAELVEEVSTGKITGEEDRYSRTDLWDIDANLEGSRETVNALRPAVEARNPELLTRIDAAFAEVQTTLDPYQRGEGWTSYAAVSQQDRRLLAAQTSALAEELALLPGTLGLSSQ